MHSGTRIPYSSNGCNKLDGESLTSKNITRANGILRNQLVGSRCHRLSTYAPQRHNRTTDLEIIQVIVIFPIKLSMSFSFFSYWFIALPSANPTMCICLVVKAAIISILIVPLFFF